jgi:hypothetical protein
VGTAARSHVFVLICKLLGSGRSCCTRGSGLRRAELVSGCATLHRGPAFYSQTQQEAQAVKGLWGKKHEMTLKEVRGLAWVCESTWLRPRGLHTLIGAVDCVRWLPAPR